MNTATLNIKQGLKTLCQEVGMQQLTNASFLFFHQVPIPQELQMHIPPKEHEIVNKIR